MCLCPVNIYFILPFSWFARDIFLRLQWKDKPDWIWHFPSSPFDLPHSLNIPANALFASNLVNLSQNVNFYKERKFSWKQASLWNDKTAHFQGLCWNQKFWSNSNRWTFSMVPFFCYHDGIRKNDDRTPLHCLTRWAWKYMLSVADTCIRLLNIHRACGSQLLPWITM